MKNNKTQSFRKTSIIIAALICITTFQIRSTNAQVSSYNFTQAAGSPTYLTSGYTTHTTGTTDGGTYLAVPIGFTFSFNCVDYTTVSICNDGWIAFGSSISSSTSPLSSGSTNNVIAALAGDLQGLSTGTLRSQTLGTAPNRTFTVEWQHYEDYSGADDYSFQIVLTETTNTIKIYYAASTTVADNTFQVGLRGASNADFNNRTKIATAGWITSSAGTVNSDVMTTGGNAARNPTGIFTWTPTAVVCSGTPAAGTASASPASVCSGTPTTLSLTSGSTGCGISYQWQSASAIGGPYTNITGATTNPYTVSPTAITYYRCISTCSNGGATNTSSVATVSMNSASSCYCTSSATDISDEDIFNVTFGTLNNSSTCATTGGTGSVLNEYSNYTGVAAPNVQQGASVAFSIQVGTCGSAYSNACAIWIDYNNDGDFSDSGEKVYTATATTSGAHTESGSITIPLSANVGLTRMRVICKELSIPTDPCGTYSYGETEDYLINIIVAPVCSGVPTGGTTTASTLAGCGHTGPISVTGSTVASDLTYQWYSSPAAGGPWTLIIGATSDTYIPSTYGLYYRRLVSCTNSGGSDYSSSLQYSSSSPINDECANAILVTPSATDTCLTTISGTIACASASSQANSCTGTADDDVWYKFVATNVSHKISLSNISGSVTDLNFAVYSGSCGSLTNILCSDPISNIATNLTVGATYYIRIYTATATTGQTTTFNLCVCIPEAGSICNSANPFCTGTTYSFPAGVNTGTGEVGPDYGCLTNTPNPVWYYLKVATAGPIEVEMYGDEDADVDFACWGPFTSNTTPCTAELTAGTTHPTHAVSGPSSDYPSLNMIDCSYDSQEREWCYIPNAQVGEYYLLLLTNYANVPQDIIFSQTGGTGATDCSIIAPPITNNGPLCVGQTLQLTVTNPTAGASYIWTGPNGFTSTTMNPSISNISLAGAGDYSMSIVIGSDTSAPVTTSVVVNSIPIPTIGSNTPICAGSALNLTSGGGISYSWSGPNSFSNATQNPTISGATTAASGNYIVTVTGTGGCTATAQTTVVVNPLPTPTIGSNTPICAGVSLNLTSGGGTGYNWSGPNSFVNATQNPTITSATTAASGTYTVTVTETGGCTATAQTTVVVNALPIPTIGSNTPICAGASLNLTSGGGTGYSWSGPNSFANATQNPTIGTATVAADGIYTVTVTGTGGCTATAQTTVVVNATPIPTAGNNGPVCEGINLNLTSSGGTGYSWSGPNSFSNATQNPTITSATTAASGTYTVTVTGTGGCTATAQTTATVNGSVAATAGSNSAICEGATLNLTAIPNGGTNYNWSGPNSFSSTSQNPSITSTTASHAGTYTVTVTLSGGCTGTAQTTVTINSLPTPTAGSNTPICAGTALNLTSGGGTGYSWSGPNTFANATQNPSIANATVAADGIYTVTVTGTGGCTATAQTTVVVNPQPSPTIGSNTPICQGITLNLTSGGGTGYSWSGPNSFSDATQNPSITSATTAASGTYIVTVTGTGGCTATSQTTVVVNALPIPTIGSNTPICAGASLNLTSGGGTGYSWSGPNSFANTTQNPSIGTATVAADGIYIVTVTGTGGCTATTQTTVVVNPNPVPTAGNSGPICAGTNLDLTSSGGTGYSWSGPNSFSNATQNPSIASATTAATGTYTVTVTGTGGCTATAQTAATVNGSVTANAGSNSAICAGATLNLTATPNGGTNYSWSGPNSFSSTSQNPSITSTTASHAGTYTVTVTLTGGCTGTAQTTVTINELPTPTIGSNSPICAGTALNLTSGGGTGYNWSGPNSYSNATQNPTIATATTAASGIYTVTVTGTGSCTSTAQTTVVINANPTPTIGSNSPICENTPLNLTSGGGTGYSWSGPNSFSNATQNPSITGASTSAAGTYTVTVTGTGSCTSTAQTTVVVNLKPTIVITPAAVQICQGNDTTLTASGATTYTWTPTLGITPATGATTTAAPNATTTYTAHGTSNGCSDSTQVVVTVINNPSITITPATISICPGEQTNLTGSGGISYTWAPAGTPIPGTDSIITVTPAGTTTYTVTGTASGCSGTATATVIIKPLPQLSFTPQNPAICINGSLSITATGADTYQWSPDTTLSANSGATVIANPQASCVYTLSGTLAGCRDSIQVPLTVNPLPTIAIQANPQNGCQPFHTTFSATSTPAAQTYAWTMENSVTSILPSPAVDFWGSGLFDVSLTITDVNGCVSSITEPDFITVHPKPNVSFTISPEFGYVSKEVIFTSSITDANSQWSWNFGDGQSATVQSPSTNHFYGTTGEMTVLHTYTNEFGCSDTASLPFNVVIKIDIPNVFTPNNDGFNDTFKIEGLDYVEGAVMKIYNRWGRKVYESDSYKNDWDGEDFADGVYFYVLTLPDFLKSGPYNGTVSLMR